MKTVLRVALCAVLIVGCKSSSSEMADMKAQVDDLTHRVKSLEDELLKAEKQQIQQQQAIQQMHDQVRQMETYFDKMQYSQTATAPH
jgi:TolA-binding protein